MKVLLDTSVLVAAMIEAHPRHEQALPWLQKVRGEADQGIVSAHSIAELYAILTTLPIQPRISSGVAEQLIQQNVLDVCQVVSLTTEDYAAIVEHLVEINLVGGVIYDALILYAARKVDVDRILTFNEKDFGRIYPPLASKVSTP